MKKPNEVSNTDAKVVYYPRIEYLKGLHDLNSKYADQFMEDSRINQRHFEELDKIDRANETLIIQNETLRINKEYKTNLIPAIAGIVGLVIILSFTFGFALAGFKDLALGIGATLIASAAVIAAITGYKNKKQNNDR